MLSERSNFRYDINGLRAIAVISVLLFHFNVPGFAGGFIGVDVFFVISGFLMTGIIIKGLERLQADNAQNSMSATADFVWQFYLARARRIVPALLVLIAVLLVIGWVALPHGDYRQLSVHSVFAFLFLSNIRFWSEAGYFDAASHEKWLLHTWTLSVEWQFYLLLPLALLLIWKLRPSRNVMLLALTAGLAASLLASFIWTIRDPSGAFFLLPTRAWQMFAGGLVFRLADRWILTERAQRSLEVVGLLLIALAICLFDERTHWPGVNATVPVAGAMALLLAARQSYWTRNSAVQWLGLSSYSLYLWHWPVFVALVYLEINDNSAAILGGLLLSVILGGLSYHGIENPSRRWLNSKGPVIVPFAIAASVLVVAVPTFAVYLQQGVPGRMPAAVEAAANEANNVNKRREQCHSMGGLDFPWCTYGGEDIRAVVVGDSHASSVVTSVLAAVAHPQESAASPGILASSYTSCPTLFGVRNFKTDLMCPEFNKFIEERLKSVPNSVPLIIVNRASGYPQGNSDQNTAVSGTPLVQFDDMKPESQSDFLAEYRQRLIDSTCRLAADRKVYLVRPIPEMPVDVPRVFARKLLLGNTADISISRETYDKRHAFINEAQDAAAAQCNVSILDTTRYLCEGGECKGSLNGIPLYYDDNHLSESGNKRLLGMFANIREFELRILGSTTPDTN